MPFAQRLRETFSTLRFRLLVWITLVVLVMEVVTSIAVREIVHRTLQYEYDQFLEESLSEVQTAVQKQYPHDQKQLFSSLEDKVQAFQFRGWFVELYDAEGKSIWSSPSSPPIQPPTASTFSLRPYDSGAYRVLHVQAKSALGDDLIILSGSYRRSLQEDIDLLNRVLLIANLSILLAAPLGGYIIALRATRPIAKIIATAAELQPGNLNERLPIQGTGDEIDQLSQTINGMLDRLATYIKHNREFVANAAHELRSPLAAIRSSVEVALNRSRTPEEYASVLADMIEEIGRLVSLVNRLLLLAEGDAGRLTASQHFTRLDGIVRESADMFEAVAESSGVRLILGEIEAAVVPGDETYLRQVVRNLIDNAIKYNNHPGEVAISLRVDHVAKQAILSVRDSGLGIPPEMLPRVFDRFYRGDVSRSRAHSRGGVGLGLSICDVIVKALGGEITVESEVGRGSTFSVRLPLTDAPIPTV